MENKKYDLSNLVRISTFARLYGQAFKEDKTPVSKQRIGQLIKAGKIPATHLVTIDETIFINKTIIIKLRQEEEA